MTLSAFAWNIVRTYTLTSGRRYSFGCRYRLGTASNLVMYVSAADNDYVGVTGTFLGTPSQGVWSTARLDFSVPPGGVAKLHFGAFGGSIPGLVQASGAATAASFAAAGAVTGATLTVSGAASTGPLDCESLDCTFTATSGGVSTGSVVCGDATSSGTVSAPQLFASNTLTVTNTSDFADDLTLTKNWAGWSKVQISNNSAASNSGPELQALVQTKSLSTQLSLHEPEEPRLPGDRRQHGQRGLQHQLHQLVGQPGEDGDGRGRPDGAPAALRLRGGQAVQAPRHERGPEAGLRLGRLRRNEVEKPDGNRPRWKPGRPSGGRRTSKHGGAEIWPTTSTCGTPGSCTDLQGSVTST